jgi:hypothetical protein
MSAADDTPEFRQAAAIFADAFEQGFSEWADTPEIRRAVRESIAGKVQRRTLMQLAYAVGCKHGQQATAAVVLIEIIRDLGLPSDAAYRDCKSEILRLRTRGTLAETVLRYALDCDPPRFPAAYEFASMLDGYEPAKWRSLATSRGLHPVTGKPTKRGTP